MHNYDELYEKLINCNWFEKCGSREEAFENFSYIWAKDLEDVAKNIDSVKWESTYIEEDNELRMYLQANYPELRILRNEQIELIEKKYVSNIRKDIKDAMIKYALPELVASQVAYLIKIIFICEFYSEQYHSEFYENLLEIYLSGHLPCGYKGRYRKGSIIIY